MSEAAEYKWWKQVYEAPCQYSKESRVYMIGFHLAEGMTYDQIGMLFGVTGGSIKYQWERYGIKTYVSPKVKRQAKISHVNHINYDNQHTEQWD